MIAPLIEVTYEFHDSHGILLGLSTDPYDPAYTQATYAIVVTKKNNKIVSKQYQPT